MSIASGRLILPVILLSIGIPFAARAAASAPTDAAAHTRVPAASGLASPTIAPPNLTLFAEPHLRGRHATYRTASIGVERQGFAARSASSAGVWTLCEGGEVASRCQTVDGQASELKFSPQIVRPGVNALALYDQPGLKGARVIYSFAADRPAPFHARSARTWGGPWVLCERGFHHCRTLEGRSQDLDLVVAAVHPQPVKAPAPVHPPRAPRQVRVDATLRPDVQIGAI